VPADGLRRAWDDCAADGIAWARTPGHDHFFWALTLPALLALLPDPGRLTVDVGGGEGRVARELKARGHKVVVVEGSAALADAARDADPDLEVLTADAAAMPLGDGAADLAVASMSLLNMDDLDAVVAEVARVLAPGGRFCLTTVHPANSLKPLGGFRAGAGYCVGTSIEGVDALFGAAGGFSIHRDNALQRIFRDAHAIRAHAANNVDRATETYGKVLLGLDDPEVII